MDSGGELSICHDCTCREASAVSLAIFLCLVLLPLLIAWTILGLLLSRSPLVAVTAGWLVFSVFAVVSIAIDPFEWGYVFGIGLDLLVVTVIVLGYEWPKSWSLYRSLTLYLLLIGALVITVLALTQFSQDGAVSGMLSHLTVPTQEGSRRRGLVDTVSSTTTDSFTVLSEASLMEAMNDGAMISGLLAIAWIICCDQSLWLPATEEKLLEAETRVLKTTCSKRVVQLVVEGLGTLIVTDEDLPGFEPNATAGNAPQIPPAPSNSNSKQRKRDQEDKPVLVLVHGYASANAYWAPVLGLLQEHFRVYCVELMGWGRSDRVPWTAKSADEVLDLYRDSIERWRMAMGLERFLLLGHSLGCHACSAYAIHYPHRVSHLIFASPAGVGLPPEAMRKKMDQNALLDYEFDTPSDTGASTLSNSSFRKNFQFSQFTYAFLSCVWESNLTPMDGLRWLGPFGHLAVGGILERRALKSGGNSFLRRLRTEQSDALIDFTYQNQAAPPSGERALAPIFMPGAYAKKPLFLWLRGPEYRDRLRALRDGDGDDRVGDVENQSTLGPGSGYRGSYNFRAPGSGNVSRTTSADDRDESRSGGIDGDAAERRSLLCGNNSNNANNNNSTSTPPRGKERRGYTPGSGGSGSGSGSGIGSGQTEGGSASSSLGLSPQSKNSPKPRGPVRTIDCPVTFIYGTPNMDWMNAKYGKDLCDQLGREGVDARLYQMSESGHIVYMEQPEEFVFLVHAAVFRRSEYQQLYRP